MPLASTPVRRRSCGSARQEEAPGRPISNCGRELNSGYCQTIQSERAPVSPSGSRRMRSPSASATLRKTSSALPSGTLPTRRTPTGALSSIEAGDYPSHDRAGPRGMADTSPNLAVGDFVDEADGENGFRGLIRRMVREGALEVPATRRYVHRLSIAGEPLEYVAVVGRKRTG